MAARLADALGICDIYVFTAEPALVEHLFRGRNVRLAHAIGSLRLSRRRWQWFLPFMPFAWRRLKLGTYGAVVTSSHACVNAIRVRPGALHISYCHTPMRYAWEWRSEMRRVPPMLRLAWPLIAALLRMQDRIAARHVTHFVANSQYVAGRVRRNYGRSAFVIYPPVDIDFWTPKRDVEDRTFFLFVGRLVAYKRVEIAVDAATRSSLPLVVAGAGPEMTRLKRRAGPSVTFVGQPSRDQLRDLYRSARALVFPGVEDFGMTAVEAQACGTPVIAFAGGGALETVVDGVTGMLYRDPTVDGLARAMASLDPRLYRVEAMRQHVSRFSAERFDEEIQSFVQQALRDSSKSFAPDDLANRAEDDLDV